MQRIQLPQGGNEPVQEYLEPLPFLNQMQVLLCQLTAQAWSGKDTCMLA